MALHNHFLPVRSFKALRYSQIIQMMVIGPGPAGTVSNVSVTNISGDLYKQGDVITIHGTAFGGSQSLLINVNSVSGYSSPSSMYYEGNGNFIYLDRIAFMDTAFDEGFPKVVRINTNGTASFVSKHNYNLDGFYPTSLFEYDGDVWGANTICTRTFDNRRIWP